MKPAKGASLDEPLGALEFKIEKADAVELKELQEKAEDHIHLRDTRPGRSTDYERPDCSYE